MPEFDKMDDLVAWLKTRPPHVSQVIASRAALRAAPVMIESFAMRGPHRGILKARALQYFRALQVSLLYGTDPAAAAHLTERVSALHSALRITAENMAEPARNAGGNIHTLGGGRNMRRRIVAAADAAVHALGTIADDDIAQAAGHATNSAAWALEKHPGVRESITRDATSLDERRRYRSDLNTTRLWHTLPPEEVAPLDQMRSTLLALEGDWQVWWRWYQDRLDGRPLDLQKEIQIADIPDDIWSAGPARANAEIAWILQDGEDPGTERPVAEAAVAPELPDRPTPISLRSQDGVLSIAPAPEGHSPNNASSASAQGWEMLRDAFDQMLDDRAAANNPLLTELRAARHALGDSFDTFNPLRLGLIGVTLQQMATRVNDILLPEDAARFQSILLQQQMLVAQSPAWREYASAIDPPMADPATEQSAAEDAALIAGEMIDANPDAFTEDAAIAIRDASALVDVEPSPENLDPVAPQEVRRSWLRIFGEMIRAFAADAMGEGRKVATKALGAGAIGMLTAVGAKLTGLADKLPTEYAWLQGLVQHLSGLVGL